MQNNENINISILQMQAVVGDVTANTKKIIEHIKNNATANLILFPELALCGYIPLDILFTPDFKTMVNNAISYIVKFSKQYECVIILPTPYFAENSEHIDTTNSRKTVIYNSAIVINNGEIKQIITKDVFPNYDVFFESRYFNKREFNNNIIYVKNTKIALVICEDMWSSDKMESIAKENPDILISINASPFHVNKHKDRIIIAKSTVEFVKAPLIYVNLVGGFDEIVFDGDSFVMNQKSEIILSLPLFKEQKVNINFSNKAISSDIKQLVTQELSTEEKTYTAIVKATYDFFNYNNFKGAIIGLSGGIDSVLVANIMCDVLGSENVIAVSMPSAHTSNESFEIINELSNNLKFKLLSIPINNLVNSYTSSLTNHINLETNNVTENIQARTRGVLLMSIANANSGYVVVNTSNKSEVAIGYSTLYGDSIGAFAPIKDLYKKDVYSIATWRNSNNFSFFRNEYKNLNLIPQKAITRTPTAELREGQFDEQELMPYHILDEILFNIIENNLSYVDMIALFDKELVNKVLHLLKSSEYKRKQGVVGVKLKTKSFGSGMRYPISNNFTLSKNFNDTI